MQKQDAVDAPVTIRHVSATVIPFLVEERAFVSYTHCSLIHVLCSTSEPPSSESGEARRWDGLLIHARANRRGRDGHYA